MRRVLAVALIIAGIFLGLWLGVWVLFVGGIVSIIEAAKANPVDAYQLAWGIIKVIIASPVGWIVFYICLMVGTAIDLDD